MDRRKRILHSIEFKPTDQVPKDLAGMRSTGISCFAYPDLVRELGLPYRRPRVYDVGQMLALPDTDVLDALDCDVAVVEAQGVTNAFDQKGTWKPYDFNGRLPALVLYPENYRVRENGTIVQNHGRYQTTMVPGSYVFDSEHGGSPLDLSRDLEKVDLKQLEKDLQAGLFKDNDIKRITQLCKDARSATERAIFFHGLNAALGFYGGLAHGSMLCMSDPDHVEEMHDLITEYHIKNCAALLPEIKDYIDIILVSATDQGLQTTSILPPPLFDRLFGTFFGKINRAIKKYAPRTKRFLHCCGAIYDLLDYIIKAEFDVLNPVQWTAGGHSYCEWKDTCRNRIALWGGGVDTQNTLPLGSARDVEKQVREIVAYMQQDSGYVFNAIHNILAEISGEKVVAMYRSAARV